MGADASDPRCPECGEPIGATATYCMHCSTDLTADDSASRDGGRDWIGELRNAWTHIAIRIRETGAAVGGPGGDGRRSDGPTDAAASATRAGDRPVLDPSGVVDDTLTVVVGIVGGLIVGLVGTVGLAAITGSGWAVAVGIVGWLGVTAYLVRRRTVQGAIAHSGYAVALALLVLPLIPLSPVVDVEGGLSGRVGMVVGLLLLVAIPAGAAAVVGWIAARFVPDDDASGAG